MSSFAETTSPTDMNTEVINSEDPIELTVTVNADVEESTVDEEAKSTDANIGQNEKIISPVSTRLLQHTHSLYHAARELEESKGRVKHEDDIWWDQRGTKPHHHMRGTLNKALAHVTSKLHTPTAATLFGSRPKANMEKIRPKPIPRLENPDIINPFVNVKSKIGNKTQAVQSQEWSAWKEKLKEDEDRKIADIAAQNAMKPKVKSTSERLLVVAEVRKSHKIQKDVDKREMNWKRVPLHGSAWKETSPLPRDNEGSGYKGDNSSEAGSPNSKTNGTSGTVATNTSTTKQLKRSHSSEHLYKVDIPDYKQYVPPPRPKSPTPCGFGSSVPRATTPTESRRRSTTPTSTGGSRAGSTPGSVSNSRRFSAPGSVSSFTSSVNGTSPVGTNARSRAAEARHRAQHRDRSSPQTTPFDIVMKTHGLSVSATSPGQSNGATKLNANANANANDISMLTDGDGNGNKMINVGDAIMQEHEMF